MTTPDLALPLDVERLLPHRPPMRLVDRLVEATLGPDCLLADVAGGLEPVALIELIAQAYAAVRGYEERSQGRPVQVGFLVGVSTITFPDLPGFRLTASTRLEIRVRTVGMFAGFALAEGEVRAGDRCLAAGGIKVWVPVDEEGGTADRPASLGGR